MSNQEAIITNQEVLNMLSLLKSDDIIKSRRSNQVNTSCDLKELLEVAQVNTLAFSRYRRSQKARDFFLQYGVEITADKNPKIQIDNYRLEVFKLKPKIISIYLIYHHYNINIKIGVENY
jgi:hypothetical protein